MSFKDRTLFLSVGFVQVKDPNDIETLDHSTEQEHGPYSTEQQANDMAKSLIQRNIDDFYHRAWVITKH